MTSVMARTSAASSGPLSADAWARASPTIRHWDVVPADQVRLVLADPGAQDGGGSAVGATLRLAARPVGALRPAERAGA
ncbi:hypothetical protein ACFV7R_30770 [Streptomyces sp. NPDC059866]|uniref:hypothetical protein n=1 Tax=Streptomyces sp. NPDC059866 TaxID=3346978 RepID=UPI00364EF66E